MRSRLFKSGVLAFSLALGGVLLSNTYINAYTTQQVVDKGYNNVVTREINEKDNKLEFNLKYPEFKLNNKDVQNKINEVLKNQINDFKKYIEDMYNEAMSTTPQDIIDNSAGFEFIGMSDYEYEVVGDVLSIRLSLIQSTGGAHPMTFVRDFNFNLNNGEVLKLGDLFNDQGKKTYKEIVDKVIKDQMNENPDNYFVDEFKGIGENVQYYLTKDNVVIFYQLYDLAPYAFGIPEFKIPYEVFNGTISTSFKK